MCVARDRCCIDTIGQALLDTGDYWFAGGLGKDAADAHLIHFFPALLLCQKGQEPKNVELYNDPHSPRQRIRGIVAVQHPAGHRANRLLCANLLSANLSRKTIKSAVSAEVQDAAKWIALFPANFKMFACYSPVGANA